MLKKIGIGVGALFVIIIVAILYLNARQTGGSLVPAKLVLNGDCVHKDTDLCKFVNNWQKDGTYVVNGTATKGSSITTSVYELDGEKKSHITASDRDGLEVYNLITIDGTSYVKDYEDSKWWEFKPEKDSVPDIKATFDFKQGAASGKEDSDKATYTKVGKEACGSLQCFKYTFVQKGAADVKSVIWFDDRDYKLRRMTTTDPDGLVKDMTFTYTTPTIIKPTSTKAGNPYLLGE